MVSELISLMLTDFISGLSDPYIKVKYKGRTQYKTKVISKSLNPRWNEKMKFKIADIAEPLLLKVLDKDLLSEDDFMGQARIDLSSLEKNRSLAV